jgi:hypothetical protein
VCCFGNFLWGWRFVVDDEHNSGAAGRLRRGNAASFRRYTTAFRRHAATFRGDTVTFGGG